MAVPLLPRPDDVRVDCARGRARPRAIAWFGFSSFWGHIRHLLASAIATENIDSRTWMVPDPPAALIEGIAAILAPRGGRPAPTVAEVVGGELWIDFVADTGDDVTVSEAVAHLLAAEYEATDVDAVNGRLLLPRGHVLFHGGDLAYPVATTFEMTRRLVQPWNRVFEKASDLGRPRVLLAVPGNHDWYDGLDGFARLCQAPCGFEEVEPGSGPWTAQLPPVPPADALHPAPSAYPLWAWAEAFARGEIVRKPGAMAFAGYVPVQRASYFRLPLTKDVELLAVDRQLHRLDDRQIAYFKVARGETRGRILFLPDPARAWGEVRPHGAATLASLGIDPAKDPSLVVAGDVHHYERSDEGPSLHVVAGGGGAFLHGARVCRRAGAYRPDVEFPGPVASRALLNRLPARLARGGSGWLVTTFFGAGDALALGGVIRSRGQSLGVAVGMAIVVAIGTALLVGWRRHRRARVLPFCTLLGVVIGALPIGLGMLLHNAGVHAVGEGNVGETIALLSAWLLSTWTSGWAFGAMLVLLARLGLNFAQPYAALGEPGYRHFLKLRVREMPDGTTEVDGFVIGQVDPVRGSPSVLVDRFRWTTAAPPR